MGGATAELDSWCVCGQCGAEPQAAKFVLPWLPSHLVADSLAVGMDQWDMTLVPVRCPESWRMKLLGCVSELSKDLLESLCLFDILTPKFWHRFGATSSCQVGHNPSMQRLVLRPTSSRQTAKVS